MVLYTLGKIYRHNKLIFPIPPLNVQFLFIYILHSECLDADFFKVVADHLVKTSGIRPILHCYAVEAIMEDKTIKGIITESKSGRRAILASRVIDCTGDADIAHFAGAKYRTTPKSKFTVGIVGLECLTA